MERKDWILAVLYSPGQNSDFCEPINSSLRIMKIIFMIGQENHDLPNFYDSFEKYLYGPCDFNVYGDISILKKEGYIDEKELPPMGFSTFTLTPKGVIKAKEMFVPLSNPIKESIKIAKKEANSRTSLTRLLQYIYQKYPGWNTNSIFNLK